MIKLDRSARLIAEQCSASLQNKNRDDVLSPCFPLTSIYNVNTTPAPKTRLHASHPSLKPRLQGVKNSPSTGLSLSQKAHFYKTYSHYGYTPKDSAAELNIINNFLLNTDLRSHHIDVLRKCLPSLTLMAEALLPLESRNALTPSQLADLDRRENVIRALISAVALLPDILLRTDCIKRNQEALFIRHTLIDEVIQGALHRFVEIPPCCEADMRKLLHSPPPVLYDKLEEVITHNQNALLQPLHNELRKHIQQIAQATVAAHRFLSKLPTDPSLSLPMPTDILHAIRTVSNDINFLLKPLKEYSQGLPRAQKTQKKKSTWLSSHGIEPAVPITRLMHTLHRNLNKTTAALETLHQHINHEHPSLFPIPPLKSFLSLSKADRTQCLTLKKMVIPVQDNADILRQSAADLHCAIETVWLTNEQPLPSPLTPEKALYIELVALTEDTPRVNLLRAIDAARVATQHILTTSYSFSSHHPIFSATVLEYSDELRRAAYLLKHAVCQTEINPRQKSILSALQEAEKTARDVKLILTNALESTSGVACNSPLPWLRKLDIDLHTHWQGITALVSKGYNNYILCGHEQNGMAAPTQIQYAVLPLLHEIEKCCNACHFLETLLGAEVNQNTIEKTTDTIKNNALIGIVHAKHLIQDTFSEKNIAVYLYYKNEGLSPVSLGHILEAETSALLTLAQKVQETAWLLSWNRNDPAVRQSLVHIRSKLRSIKQQIKDTVETATGIRPHINSTEGMIAKDAAEWLTQLKKSQDSNDQNDTTTKLIDRLCKEFISPDDPEGTLFRLRITLALHEAEQDILIWPPTPEARLNTVKTPKDYTLAWSEKRLTYSMLYNCLIHYTPAALFSLNMVKNTLVSPLRLINFLLTPVRMAVTRKAMQKVRPGSETSFDVIDQYTVRELYQAVFRVVSMLSPQLFKTAFATGFTAYGLKQGGQYRHAFLTRAISRLPGDLFWVGGFAAGYQAVKGFHALQQQNTFSPEQSKQLQSILNLNSMSLEDKDLFLPTLRRQPRHTDAFSDTPHNNDSLQKAQINTLFKDNAIDSLSENTAFEHTIAPPLDDKSLEFIYSYYCNNAPHSFHETSLDWWWRTVDGETTWTEQETDDPKIIIIKNYNGEKIKAININHRWYLNDWAQQKTYLYTVLNELNALPPQSQHILDAILHAIFKAHPETQPRDALHIANTLLSIRMLQHKSEANSIFKVKYSLLLAAPNTINGLIDAEQRKILQKLAIPMTLDALQKETLSPPFTELDKNIAVIRSYYLPSDVQKHRIGGENSYDWWWNDTKEGTCCWTDESPIPIHVTEINDKWYLNGWKQQKDYLYANLNGLNTLLEPSKHTLDAIFYRIFKNNPETSLEDTVKIANAELSILMFQHIHDSLYVNDIAQIKYALIAATSDKSNEFIDEVQTNILHKLHIPINIDALEEAQRLFDPVVIDTEKYKAAFIKRSQIPLEDIPSVRNSHDPYYKGMELCTQFLQSAASDDESPVSLFHKARLYFTQQQLMLLSKPTMTQQEKEQLIELNIAKYYLYTSFPLQQQTPKDDIIIPLPTVLLEKTDDHHANPNQHATQGLLELSKQWKESMALPWKEGDLGTEGNVYLISNHKYIYLRGLLWKVVELSENNMMILTEKKDGTNIIQEITRVDSVWDLVSQDTETTSDSLDSKLILIKFFLNRHRLKTKQEVTSLHWWLNTAWQNTQSTLSKNSEPNLNNSIIMINNKKYLNLYPYYWEYEGDEGNSAIGTLKNKLGATVNIRSDNNGNWYLNDWAQQQPYFASALNGIETLSQDARAKLNDITEKVFKVDPEIELEYAIKIVNIALSILLFQHKHDKPYVNDILEIKYLLMFGSTDFAQPFIDDEQMNILHALTVPTDIEALKENLSQLYPYAIDNKKYITALRHYYADSADTTDNNDPYHKGISYCDHLVTKFKNENSQLSFNQILFYLTKKELTIPITEGQNEELIWLNIAKHHLYAISKCLPLQEFISQHADIIPFSTDNNIFTVLKRTKADALRIYYLYQEGFDKSSLNLDEQTIEEQYSHILGWKNEASDCLKMITSILFYQTRHPQEKMSGFDLIKAEIYYRQQVEQFTKEMYTFDVTPPPHFTSYRKFKPSDTFSSRSDYTKQFNDYVHNGSSEYESKLLTPLLLSQFDISVEDLSLPPKRWFTLQLHCYDYPQNHLSWSIHNTIVWPEKLNIIQLHSGNYLTISEINGNMKANVISEDAFNLALQEKTKENTYFYAKSDNAFLNALIGPIPPTTAASRNCELKFYEEKQVPERIKIAVQHALYASLNALAGYEKDALETITLTRNILEMFVPFYKEVYRSWTDSEYTTDKTSLLLDSIFVFPALKSLGVSLKALESVESVALIDTLKQGINKGLNRAMLAEFVSNKIPQNYISSKSSLAGTWLAELIKTMPIKAPPSGIIRKGNTIIDTVDIPTSLPLNTQITYPVPLTEPGEFGHYKGIYTVLPTQTNEETRYFIKNGEAIYQVRWDNDKYIWRLVDNKNPLENLYGMPIRYTNEKQWFYNTETLRLKGGGIETKEIITQAEEVISEFQANTHVAKTDAAPTKDIFISKNILEDKTAIRILTRGIKTAQNTAIEMLTEAKNILTDKAYDSRVQELIRIFTNRQDKQTFVMMFKELKKALQNLKVEHIKLVNVEDTTVFAQIAPHFSSEEEAYLAINYSGYQKNKELIFAEQVSQEKREFYANENFARALIHEFTHVNSIIETTDEAGYIELLRLNGHHDVTKLLIKAKLGLPEVRNNADSVTEIIFILYQAEDSELHINEFLKNYRNWEIEIEKAMHILEEKVKTTVAQKTQLSWSTTSRTEILRLKEEYNIEMCKQLIANLNKDYLFV